jgi:histidinol-phosphate aminotransferase
VPLVSTVLMTATLARIAGCPEIAAFTPCGPDGRVAPALLAALDLVGVTEIYRIGGAHAVGAMAYGTSSIPAVDKIFGPGNAYVCEAKRQVFGLVGVDLLPGPSELMVVADDSARADFAAADLIAQAEHGSGREKVYLVSTSARIIGRVAAQMRTQLVGLPRSAKVTRILDGGFLAIQVRNLGEAAEVANRVAPEHLELLVRPGAAKALVRSVTTAGAILVGNSTPTALGDFAAGPSHVLPTGGAGRFSSGLRVSDFLRRTSLLSYDPGSLRTGGAHRGGACRDGEAGRPRPVGRDPDPAQAMKGQSPGRLALAHVSNLHAYTPGLQPAGPGWVKLNTNECPYPPSPRVAEAVIREVGGDGDALRLYPDPTSSALRDALARLHGVDATHVCAGNGSDDILNLLVRCFCGPAAAAAFTLPGYSLYPVLVGIQDSAVTPIPFDRSMRLPVDRISASRARVFFLTSPNAPTGVGFPTSDIARILESFDGILVVDEAYAPFASENALGLLAGHPNLVIVRTLSKAYALAGIRVGYALAAPEVIGLLDRVRDSYNVSRLSQAAAIAALGDPGYYEAIVDKIKYTRDYYAGSWEKDRGVVHLSIRGELHLHRAAQRSRRERTRRGALGL